MNLKFFLQIFFDFFFIAPGSSTSSVDGEFNNVCYLRGDQVRRVISIPDVAGFNI